MKNTDSLNNDAAAEELEEFRKRWKEELNKKSKTTTIGSNNASETSKDILDQHLGQLKESNDIFDSSLRENRSKNLSPESNKSIKHKALEIYATAADKEREGNLSEALKYYRQALKLDPNVDYAYKKHLDNIMTEKKSEGPGSSKFFVQHLKEELQSPPAFSGEGNAAKSSTPHHNKVGLSPYRSERASSKQDDSNTALINSFQNTQPIFEPLKPEKPVYIAKLPNELIICILEQFVLSYDVTSLERVGLICKKFFFLSRTPSLWRYLSENVYRDINILPAESNRLLSKDVELLYDNDWRKMFIERPRIRLDGVYISTCNYVRAGSMENAWNQPIHLVTYYRYLRFHSNGACIVLLTTTEPKYVVKQFMPEYKSKGFMNGTWLLDDDNTLLITATSSELPKFTFYLKFDLRSTSRGGNNKLSWVEYSRVNNQTYEETEISQRNERSYFFSKVYSYAVI